MYGDSAREKEREKKSEWVVLTIPLLSSPIILVIILFTKIVTHSLSYSVLYSFQGLSFVSESDGQKFISRQQISSGA